MCLFITITSHFITSTPTHYTNVMNTKQNICTRVCVWGGGGGGWRAGGRGGGQNLFKIADMAVWVSLCGSP